MNILVSGSSGFIGKALVKTLHDNGHTIIRLVRSLGDETLAAIRWDPEKNEIEESKLASIDIVVHLAGENPGTGRWNDAKKDLIYSSRVLGTSFLSKVIELMPDPPKVFVSASATGFYGNRGDEILTEKSSRSSGFLAEMVHEWETSTWPASHKGVRVVLARIGVVMDPAGGMLGKVLPMFRTGLGSRLGPGTQWLSWIAMEDTVGAIVHSINTESLSGPVNVVAPNPVTNLEFTKTLADIVDRNPFFPIPDWALQFALGDMADEMLLASQRVVPKKLLESGYRFKFEKLKDALREIIDVT